MESKSRHYQYMALVETHVHTKADLRDWESASRQLRLRLHYNAARPSGKKVSKNKASCSNEGGEFFLAQAHLQAYKLAEAHVAAKHLRDGHHRSLDGFLPMVLQFSGYSVAYIVLYGHPTIQMSGKNRLRFQRIGAVLQALKMPWVLCGDFNMTPATLLKSEFPQRLDAVIRTADVVGTCSQKKDKPDTMIDYVLCSKSALPFIRDIVPVRAVPWRPHIGLEIHFRSSGANLITRVLDLPQRLPQTQRPRTEPTPDSKSSKAKAARSVACSLAREKTG